MEFIALRAQHEMPVRPHTRPRPRTDLEVTSRVSQLHTAHIRADARGPASSFEVALRFTMWAGQQQHLTWHAIHDEWGVSKATAYRWLAGWRAATGAKQ